MPMASCSRSSGTRPSKGPSTTTISARTARPATTPNPAGRQPRTVATASTIVSASTASTSEARKAVVIAEPKCKPPIIMTCLSRPAAKAGKTAFTRRVFTR